MPQPQVVQRHDSLTFNAILPSFPLSFLLSRHPSFFPVILSVAKDLPDSSALTSLRMTKKEKFNMTIKNFATA